VSGPIGGLALVLIGYLIGALPFGLLAGRLAGGVDLRQTGSRRTGATNTVRTLGWRWGAAVLLLDVAKGAAAVLVARALYAAGPPGSPEWVHAAAGVAAVVGHNWSVLIGFRGGRGVATAGGGMLVLSPLTLLVVVPVAALVIWRTRYVSLGSLAAAIGAPIVTAALALAGGVGWAAAAYAAACGLLIVISHGDNVARLRAGTERRLGEREPAARAAVADGRG
jgi:glycerol-3-phosphate acyltransferase PlsY